MTNNERTVVDILKENKNFVYLITQPLENLTVNKSASSIKGLSGAYSKLTDATIQYLLTLHRSYQIYRSRNETRRYR